MRTENLRDRKPWRFWQAIDITSLMRLNTFPSQILGFVPFKFKSGIYVFSIEQFGYSLILIIVYLFLLFMVLYMINFYDTDHFKLTEALDANVFYLLDGFAIFPVYIVTYKRFILYRKVAKVSQMLSQQDFNAMAKFIHTKDAMVIFYVLVNLPNCIDGINSSSLCRLTTLYIVTSHFTLDMCYVNYVSVLGACFKKVNENLKKLNEPAENHQAESSLVRKPLLRKQSLLTLMKLKHYERLHEEISDVVEQLNETFLIQIIIASITTFTTVTFNTYFSIIWMATGFKKPLKSTFWYIPYFVIPIYYFSKFSLMIWACQNATNQAHEISTTVHDVLSGCTDDMVKRELRNFALQVLHRDIHFSARAITMNAKLLTQIVSAIVLYILILLQFLLYSVFCD